MIIFLWQIMVRLNGFSTNPGSFNLKTN